MGGRNSSGSWFEGIQTTVVGKELALRKQEGMKPRAQLDFSVFRVSLLSPSESLLEKPSQDILKGVPHHAVGGS